MKKIRITLDNIEGAVSEIDDLIKQMQNLPQKLAESAVPVAQGGYWANDVAVSAEQGNVIARGDQVGFAEYGTGIYAQYDADAPIPTGYSTWSSSPDGSRKLANYGYWYYNGVRYEGTLPAHAMREAVQHLKQNGSQIARDNIK